MNLDMSQTVVLILVIGMLAALVTLVICKIQKQRRNRMLPAPRFQVGEVTLNEQGVNYLVGRMRDRILETTNENERLKRELYLLRIKHAHLMALFNTPSESWEDFCSKQ